jgi:hypothetical protein
MVPMSLILDAVAEADKFLIINWWKAMKTEDQKTWWGRLKAFYLTPTKDNSRNIITTAAAAGLPAHVGRADSQATLDTMAELEGGGGNQKRRRLSDQAARTCQKHDRVVRRGAQTLFAQTDTLNNATTDANPEAPTAGYTHSVSITITNVSSPPETGFHGPKKALRDKPLIVGAAQEQKLWPAILSWRVCLMYLEKVIPTIYALAISVMKCHSSQNQSRRNRVPRRMLMVFGRSMPRRQMLGGGLMYIWSI